MGDSCTKWRVTRLSGEKIRPSGQHASTSPSLFPTSWREWPESINSGRRNKFYIRLCALLLFQARAHGAVDISGRVLVTKRSVDLSQSLGEMSVDPSFSVSFSTPRLPRRLSVCLFLILRFASPRTFRVRLSLSLPRRPLPSRSSQPPATSSSSSSPSRCIPRCRFH